ncbi:MAG: ThuA domain-containing protein [Phaeodactylibacter sp.]|nr:ThuA domain-containing protein [Phaeodactylibacter sp.]MCB9299748.1 ThuA domain-containing protein [Lewinellaceae bacterium]
MRYIVLSLSLIVILLTACLPLKEAARARKVLVFSRTEGFRHESIEAGVEAIKALGRKHDFQVIATEDSGMFREEVLRELSAIVFLNTTGDVLNNEQQAAMERFIQAGGGFVGVHSATDTEYDWPWYGQLVGGYFNGHPHIQPARLKVKTHEHPATAELPDAWERTDEWYNLRDIREGLNVLVEIDENSYEGGTNGDFHPMAWYQEYDGGRAFYTAGGHVVEAYSEPLFLAHLAGGIEYAIGPNQLNYANCRSYLIPEESRFVRTILAHQLDEPMELAVLPDGRVLFIERKGLLKMYTPRLEMTTIASYLPVHTEHEDGLLGLALDPDFQHNNWVYLFYSPPGKKPIQRVSRFVFKDDSLHLASEQLILEIPVQREECCHSAGSLAFGPDGLLYISVGDNTNPFASEGYDPIDERPGRSAWDAQRSSGNTNDLRGKILRIRPEADGSYSIPEGNLFPPGTPQTRPEIYVMGCRNPFRISVDQRRNWLFWGDVGPDAGKGDSLRGPKGLDEFNLAQNAGFWGWPYTRGNNQSYHDFNFATRRSGPLFDPQHLINDSPNNTGLRELPPARPSLIWYSYDESEEFPWTDVGGKNPMAGPVYYSDQYQGPGKFPPYFDGKLIIYEWMRHWLYVVHLDSLGHFLQADPLMPSEEFSRPMDMAFAPDGALYMLEYGNLWFARNEDARLTRISYLPGNRPPTARLAVSATAGAAPLKVELSALPSIDYDEDPLVYQWAVNGQVLEETAGKFNYVFQRPGIYKVRLEVKDKSGASSAAEEMVSVGNAPPVVAFHLDGNSSFFWDGRRVKYRVSVQDEEDGSLGSPTFPEGNVTVGLDFLPEGVDRTLSAAGHLVGLAGAATARGARLIEQSDCKNCHALDKKVNGPAYLDVAQRYAADKQAPRRLALKIINGGSGNWGETVMSAHPLLSEEQAADIVNYILSLGRKNSQKRQRTPLAGVFTPNQHKAGQYQGAYVLSASYTDTGNGALPSLTARDELLLRPLRIEAEQSDEIAKGMRTFEEGKQQLLGAFRHGRYFALEGIDLAGLSYCTLRLFFGKDAIGGQVGLHLDSPDGPLLSEAKLQPLKPGYQEVDLPLTGGTGIHSLYFVFENKDNRGAVIASADWVQFMPEELLP